MNLYRFYYYITQDEDKVWYENYVSATTIQRATELFHAIHGTDLTIHEVKCVNHFPNQS